MVLQGLPRYPSAVEVSEPLARRDGAEAFYDARGSVAEVLAFYAQELQKQGWRPAGDPTVMLTDKLLDGTVGRIQQAIFIKGQTKVTISVSESEKDPKLNLGISVRVELH